MNVKICVGSSCHLKGSRQVVEGLRSLVEANHLGDKVILSGAFCMNNCVNGVSVTVDDKLFSVQPENVERFFQEQIIDKL